MIRLPFDSHAAPVAVRRPTVAIQVGGPGGWGGSASSPIALGGIDPRMGGADPWQRNLVSLSVQLGIAPFVDEAVITLVADGQAPAVALEEAGTIALGYADGGTIAVFKGQIRQIRRTLQGTTVVRLRNGGDALTRLRLNQSVEQQSAGKIVRALANQAEVAIGTLEDGLELPAYVLKDSTPAYQHIATLAQKSGYIAYLTPAGTLCFGPPVAGEAVQPFVYGQDILALEMGEMPPSGGARVIGEGAAGSQGTAAWNWLVADPAGVTAGTGAIRADGAIRSRQAATQMAGAIAQQTQSLSHTGRLWVAGAGAITVGSTFALQGIPDDALNGPFLAYQVWHRYSKTTGFTTLIHFRNAPSRGGLGGVPGGLV